jgi:hypothetical protein
MSTVQSCSHLEKLYLYCQILSGVNRPDLNLMCSFAHSVSRNQRIIASSGSPWQSLFVRTINPYWSVAAPIAKNESKSGTFWKRTVPIVALN